MTWGGAGLPLVVLPLRRAARADGRRALSPDHVPGASALSPRLLPAADREELRQILFLIWSHVFHDLPDEAFAAGLDKLGDRYEMLPRDVPVPLPEDLAGDKARP